MSINAYVFARSGSKGLQNKNKVVLDGYPLYAHSLRAIQAAGIFANVYISTNDREIANECKHFMADCKVIVRPHALCTDDSPEWLSWRHAIANSDACDVFVSVPTTCPLRAPQDIVDTVKALTASKCNPSAVTVTEAQHNPYFTACINQEAEPRGLRKMYDVRYARRQEAPTVYNVCGVAYAVRPSFIMGADSLWDGRPVPVVVPQERALDIDTPHDFLLAQLLLKYAREQRERALPSYPSSLSLDHQLDIPVD